MYLNIFSDAVIKDIAMAIPDRLLKCGDKSIFSD